MTEKNEFGQILGAAVENWTPRERPAKKRLIGQYCVLQPLDIDQHAADLFAAISKDNLGDSWTYLPYGPFFKLPEFLQWMKNTMADPDTLLYAICDPETNQPIGICGYMRINPQHGSIEVGHLHYSKQLKQTPAATEAMFLMMRNAMEDLQYRRYEWKCNSLNQPSIDAALRLGFQYEGTFRQANVYKNHNRDTAWFSVLDSEWPALRARFLGWLDAANFDSSGKQRKRLQDV